MAPEGVLFRGAPDAKVKDRILTEYDVQTVLSLPAGRFLPYTGVKTNVLFFDRSKNGKTTESVWFYERTNDGFELKQTRKRIAGDQFPDFLEKQKTRADSERSWSVPVGELKKQGFDLSARTPNKKDVAEPSFVADLMNAPQFLKVLRHKAKHAIGQSSINQDDLLSTEIPLPALVEQSALAARISATDKRADELVSSAVTADEVMALRAAILRKAFSGEL